MAVSRLQHGPSPGGGGDHFGKGGGSERSHAVVGALQMYSPVASPIIAAAAAAAPEQAAWLDLAAAAAPEQAAWLDLAAAAAPEQAAWGGGNWGRLLTLPVERDYDARWKLPVADAHVPQREAEEEGGGEKSGEEMDVEEETAVVDDGGGGSSSMSAELLEAERIVKQLMHAVSELQEVRGQGGRGRFRSS